LQKSEGFRAPAKDQRDKKAPVEDPANSRKLEPSDFPEGEKRWKKTEPILECTVGLFQKSGLYLL
jgi:hypothetical protein